MVPWTNGALRGVELGTVMFIHRYDVFDGKGIHANQFHQRKKFEGTLFVSLPLSFFRRIVKVLKLLI